MWKIYKAYRDAEYMAQHGHDRASVLGAMFRAFRAMRILRRSCARGVHYRLDVWDNRCWHERLNDKIERLGERQKRDVWSNPEIVWSPLPEDHPAAEAGISSGYWSPVHEGRKPQDEIDYHPWRSP